MSFEEEEPGTIRGWGVVRSQPSWHLAGIFPTEAEATVVRDRLGGEYIVRFGQGRPEFDEFYWSTSSARIEVDPPHR